MIIKSMSRKTASFRQLIEYFHKEKTADRDALTHNLMGNTAENAVLEMEDNAKYLPKRRGGNIVYHEIISLPENAKVPIPRQIVMLEDCVRYYIQRRCPNCLVYGKLHRDKKHLHYHLAISANNLKARNRHWLSKAGLAQIQKEVENYRIATFPELGMERYYDAQSRQRRLNMPHLTDREQAYKYRTGKLSRKERDHQQLRGIFDQVKTEADLSRALRTAGFELYRRGRIEGVMAADGRKYRLKTLGLETALQTTKKRIDVFSERQKEFSRSQGRPNEPNRGRA